MNSKYGKTSRAVRRFPTARGDFLRFTGCRLAQRIELPNRRSPIISILDAGAGLDLEVARRVLGSEVPGEPPAYSSDDVAAERLRDSLEAAGTLRCTFEPWEGTWYCTWWTVAQGATRERLSSGSGPTRALAFCRACVNLPAWATPPAVRSRPMPAPPPPPRACESCGSEERMRGRARAVRLCNVCAWKAGKLVQDRRFG
jgi:hypothetical protein